MSTPALSLLLAILFGVAAPMAAAEIPLVRGRVRSANHEVVEGLFVSMEGASSHLRTGQADIRIDGSFEFREIPTGDYTLRVTDGSGQTVCQEYVTVREPVAEFEIRLPERESDRRATQAATVSLNELMHPPDKKALRAFQSALRLAAARNYDEAATELEKAIRISPEFAAAHTNLAAQYFRLGRFEESAEESARAIQIGGPRPENLCNLATAQARLQRWEEAEKSARAALHLNSGYVRANLVLGVLLVDHPATRNEGIRNLEKAAPTFASARLFLERLRASQ